jgi:hypothetical protein
MSCFKSASAVVVSGTTGFLLVIKVNGFAGIVKPTYEKGTPPFNPANVFPLKINGFVPSSLTPVKFEITHNLKSQDEFESVEIFCGDKKPGTIIPVTTE